jgi:hypothetical protein
VRFVEELVPRLQRAGASGPKLLRADSGFESKKITARLQRAGWTYSIGARQHKHIKAAITAIAAQDWEPLEDYPETGRAQIAQTVLGHQRLIIRRTRLVGAQAELWPDWRHFAFLTNRTDPIELVEAEHRQHAVVELAIRDPQGSGVGALPIGNVPRERSLDGDGSARAQPPPLDHPHRTTCQHHRPLERSAAGC